MVSTDLHFGLVSHADLEEHKITQSMNTYAKAVEQKGTSFPSSSNLPKALFCGADGGLFTPPGDLGQSHSFCYLVTEIDTAYGVSERIHEVTTKVNSIDEQYGITKSINTAVLSASQQVQSTSLILAILSFLHLRENAILVELSLFPRVTSDFHKNS